MRSSLRVYFPIAVMLGVPMGLWAQGQDAPATVAQTQNTNAVARPVRKPDRVVTNDPIALLAVRRREEPVNVAPVAEKAKTEGAAADDVANRAAEMALVEKQIKDKQKRIELLMRLFVDDERAFLIDPGNTNVDAAVAERRRYEQDELRWETAELAKLKTRWEALGGQASRQPLVDSR